MITRQQYMENSGELHHKYYSQFVTPSTIRFVKTQIGVDKLKQSKCKHLNDIVKMNMGSWLWDYSPINSSLAKELGEGDSKTTRTCVGKAAARIILDRDKTK